MSAKADRRAAGLCITCGEQLPKDPGHPTRVNCAKCRSRSRGNGVRYQYLTRQSDAQFRAPIIEVYAARVGSLIAQYGEDLASAPMSETIFS